MQFPDVELGLGRIADALERIADALEKTNEDAKCGVFPPGEVLFSYAYGREQDRLLATQAARLHRQQVDNRLQLVKLRDPEASVES